MIPHTGFSAHPEDLRWGFRASSILDIVLCLHPDDRYHIYLPDRFPGVDVGILDHGSGDELFCFFDAKHGCLIKGFDHESPMSPQAQDVFETWPGIFDEAPPELLVHLDDPEFRKTETTFCIWRRRTDKHWWEGNVQECEEGEWSEHLLKHCFRDAESWLDWATGYYDRTISKELVERIFDSCEIDQLMALAINPETDLDMVRRELGAMGMTLK